MIMIGKRFSCGDAGRGDRRAALRGDGRAALSPGRTTIPVEAVLPSQDSARRHDPPAFCSSLLAMGLVARVNRLAMTPVFPRGLVVVSTAWMIRLVRPRSYEPTPARRVER